MALDKNSLKSEIKTLLEDMLTKEQNAVDEFADRLASAVDTFVKSATITVQAGIPLNAGGYAGATTGTGTATIS